jgi:hypothetical protein
MNPVDFKIYDRAYKQFKRWLSDPDDYDWHSFGGRPRVFPKPSTLSTCSTPAAAGRKAVAGARRKRAAINRRPPEEYGVYAVDKAF